MTGREEYLRWLQADTLTEEERQELEAIREQPQEIRERFFAPLSFGTAGLRGIMGAGIRRMNGHVVAQATRALGLLMLRQDSRASEKGAVVCFDCRLHSREYAAIAAVVLAELGIRVSLFETLHPTPELSFAIRELGALAGINITASHNPKEYNGYKVYWEDGAQLPPEHAAQVAAIMAEIDPLRPLPRISLPAAIKDGRIRLLGADMDERFLTRVLERSIDRDAVKNAALRIVYTPFNGAGAKLVPEALRRLGVEHLFCVAEQMEPDGTFPTAKNPNPEFEIGFERALLLAKQVDADLIIGTDPDSDRLGLMVRRGKGDYQLLTGNQVGVLFLDYLCTAGLRKGTLPPRPMALKSIVSSEMTRAVADHYGVGMEDTFTGFKFLAERMKQHENDGVSVIFAYEEAIGYAFGTFVRDKDAVTASVMAAEMASVTALRDKTLLDRLEELYALLGRYEENTISLVMPGVDGLEKMGKLMERLRSLPPETLGGERVSCLRDYRSGEARYADGHTETLAMKDSDVLYFVLEDGSRFIVRPSGTEPKIKCYLMVKGEDAADCRRKLEKLAGEANRLAEG